MFGKKPAFSSLKLVLTCEHGGNEIPTAYQELFEGKEELLRSHRGYDPGTLNLFNVLKGKANFSKENTVSRLLIEMNRSVHHPQLFSEIIKTSSAPVKTDLIENYYVTYRLPIEKAIASEIGKGQKVFHLSLHSFTPKLQSEIRNNDIGLLYDPKRKEEKELCKTMKEKLLKKNSSLKIRFNYPYLGTADGFTTYLRKCFPENYLGIELEINQALVKKGSFPEELKKGLGEIISDIIQNAY